MKLLLRSLPAFLVLAVVGVGCPNSDRGEEPELTALLSADSTEVYVGVPIRFDAGSSTDSTGTDASFSDSLISGFDFDFGDGDELSTEVFYVDHAFAVAGEFTVSVTVSEGDNEDSDSVSVVVRFPPPTVLELDVSGDEQAVIGEWVTLVGRAFREANLPTVAFDGIVAPNVVYDSEFEILVQVPPKVDSGWSDVEVNFPDEDEGDGNFQVWVTRYGLATDAWRGVAYITEFGDGDQYWPRSQNLDLASAAVVRMSGDGSFALLGDARYQATLTPSVSVVDMTSDWQPAIVADLDGLGTGPLFDIAIARDIPRAVITDATGFVVLDLSDLGNAVQVGDRETFDFGDMAPTATALSPDGTRLAVLSTFNDRVRFYSITPSGPVYESWSVDVGAGTQDLAVFDEPELLAVLGGGGEGAIPPDFDLGNTSVTLVDMGTSIPENSHGDGTYLDLSGAAPVPIDLAAGESGTLYISSLDSNFGNVLNAFEDVVSNPLDISAWQDVIESLGGLGFGSVIPVDGVMDGSLVVDAGLFSAFGFQGGVDVRPDEHLYISTVIGLGWTLDILTGGDLLNLSLDIDYGVAVGNLLTGEVEVFPQYSQPVVSYVNFSLTYDIGPLVAMLLPPYAFGDVAIQP